MTRSVLFTALLLDPVLIDFKGWRRVVFSPRTPQRGPHDGVSHGDGRPNPDRLAGLAFAVVAAGEQSSSVFIDAVTVHK